MKKTKPKTIEKITRKHFRSFYHAIKLEPVLGEKGALELADTIVNSCSKQIKQLIADEVIKNTTVELRGLLNSRMGADITDTTASICGFFEKEQRKKLERL